MKNFTFIIPHKDSPFLLQRCIDSIPQREDIQIIIVDDNSNPKKVNFKNFPGLNRENTEIYFTKEGRGAGYARNVGLEHAKGKWLLFADADDFYTPNLSLLLDTYREDDTNDLVYLNAQIIDEEENIKPYASSFYINNFLKGKWLSENVLRYEMWSPWTRMVKLSFIKREELTFEEIPIANDLKFGLECSKFAQKISVFEPVIYNYVQPKGGSITAHKYSIQTYGLRLRKVQWMNNFFKEVGYPFPRSYFTYCKLNYLSLLKEKKQTKENTNSSIYQIKINIFYEFYKLAKRAFAKALKIISK